MKEELTFKTEQDFQDYINNEKYNFSKYMVEKTFNFIPTELDKLVLSKIFIKETNTIFEIVLDRKHIIETLEENLFIFEEAEDYEGCKKIFNKINELKNEIQSK